MQIYERIKNLRKDYDITQEEIAKLLKTTRPQYARYERAEREIPTRHLITLCEYYHVSADHILGLPERLPYGKSKTRKK